MVRVASMTGGVGAGLGQDRAAVDDERLAGDVARTVRRQEQDHFRDLVGLDRMIEEERNS